MKFESIGPVVSEEMFENVDGRTDDGRTTDAGVTGILIAHLRAFGSGELKKLNHQVDTLQSSRQFSVMSICFPG